MLPRAQHLDGAHRVGRCRIQLFVDLVVDAILLASDDADLHLEDDLRGGAVREQAARDLEILLEIDRGAVPHVRLEQWVLAAVDALLAQRDQRSYVRVELVLRAVVGVQRNCHVVSGGDHVRVLGERDRAGDHVLDPLTGQELRAAGRDLDDAVAARLREAGERGVERLRRRHVDRRIGERASLCAIEHLGVGVGGRNRHRLSSVRWLGAVRRQYRGRCCRRARPDP